MSQESEQRKKEPPREKPDGTPDPTAPGLPPPAEAPALREKVLASKPSSLGSPPKKAAGPRFRRGDLEGTLRSGLIVLLVVAVAALLWLGLRGALRASAGFGTSSAGPEKVARVFLTAVKRGDAEEAMSCVDWDRVLLQSWGRDFGELSDARKEEELEKNTRLMKRMLGDGGEIQRRYQKYEMRILQTIIGSDAAEVRVLYMSLKTGKEEEASLRLENRSGAWKIYRLPEL